MCISVRLSGTSCFTKEEIEIATITLYENTVIFNNETQFDRAAEAEEGIPAVHNTVRTLPHLDRIVLQLPRSLPDTAAGHSIAPHNVGLPDIEDGVHTPQYAAAAHAESSEWMNEYDHPSHSPLVSWSCTR